MSAAVDEIILVNEPKTDGMYCDVVIQATTKEAVSSPQAREAAKSFCPPGFSPRLMAPDSPVVYPVNKNGECDDKAALDMMTGAQPIAGYQAAFKFCAGI